eukprot:g18666.t1
MRQGGVLRLTHGGSGLAPVLHTLTDPAIQPRWAHGFLEKSCPSITISDCDRLETSSCSSVTGAFCVAAGLSGRRRSRQFLRQSRILPQPSIASLELGEFRLSDVL